MTPSNTATVRGTVHAIGETQTVGAKGFRKRLLVLNATRPGGKYPDYIVATLTREGVDWADTIQIGEPVELKVALKGREWQGRWFADVEVIEGWTLEQAAPPEPVRQEPPPSSLPSKVEDLADDDVPF